MNRILLLLFIAIGLSLSLSAQTVPQGFNYQSIVRDDNGSPLANQTITMLLTIRSGAPNGPVAYSEKQVASTNEYGLINLIIGQGGTTLQGAFATINWGGGAKYLTVSVETSPNVFDELGSSQLMSVPYAMFAQTAGGGGGGTTGDNWGSQVVQTGPALEGNGTAASPVNLSPQGAQTGQVLKWDGSKWLPQDDIVSTSTGGGTVTQINTGPGLNGGPITTSGTIGLENTGVTPGTYGSASQIPVFTVDALGRVTQVFTTVVSPGNPVAINAGNGIQVLQQGTTFTIVNTGDANAGDDLSAASQAGGDVAGPFSNLQIQPNTIGSSEILDNAVGASEILDNAVGSSEIAANAVGSAEIAPDAVNTSELADDAVGSAEIADNAVGSTELSNGAVTAAKLANGAVTNAKIADATIEGEKLASMGANPGQVLKWNGTTWEPAVDLSGGGGGGSINLTEGPGIDITGSSPNLTITNTGDTNPDDDITTAIQANGDVSGPFSNLQIKANAVGSGEIANNAVGSSEIDDDAVGSSEIANNAVGSSEIDNDAVGSSEIANNAVGNTEIADNAVGSGELANGAVTSLKIDDMGADAGEVLKFNGTAWVPGPDNGGGGGGSVTVLAGPGIDVSQSGNTVTVSNTGDPDEFNDLTVTTNFNGDVTGTYDDIQLKPNTVTNTELANNAVSTGKLANEAVTGPKIDDMNADPGQVLKYNGTTWAPADDIGGGGGTGDDWGSQVAITDNNTLAGNGTPLSPLRLAPQGAASGQVLKFNGITWEPANDEVGGGGTGDDWGNQVALTTARLSGNGAPGSPLDIAQQNAGTGQVLKWNGTAWAPGNDLTGGIIGGDNWGTQVAITGNTLKGEGTNASPLDLDPQGATNGQVLKFNGTTWVPGADQGTAYTAGNGIGITGTTISNTGDLSNTNELQTLNLTGNQLSLSNGGGTVTLPSGGGNNYAAGNGISITGSAPNFTINNTGDGDASPTNELQNLNLTGAVLTISGTNSSVDFNNLLANNTNNFWKMDAGNIFNLNANNVLIGTQSSTSGKLQVVASGTGEAGRFTNNGSSASVFAENLGSGPALVTGMGNVGINTNSPAFRLDVAGNQRILSTGAQPQLTLEQGASDYARLVLKGAGGGRLWTLEGNSSGSTSEFHLDLSTGGTGKVRFISALNDGDLFFGNDDSPVSATLFHDNKGLKLQNINTDNNWEFVVDGTDLVLRANGNVAGSFAQNGIYTASDRRLKKDIASMTGVLNRLMTLQPVTYHYKQETAADKMSYGFLAQDVQPLFPELVGHLPGPDGKENYLSVNYGGFSVLAIRAIQEQQQQIKTLQDENDALRQRMEALEARMSRIEKALNK